MMFLGWFDDNPKRATPDKVRDACEAYRARFGCAPTIVLMSADDCDAAQDYGTPVRTEGYIRRNNFWVGRDQL